MLYLRNPSNRFQTLTPSRNTVRYNDISRIFEELDREMQRQEFEDPGYRYDPMTTEPSYAIRKGREEGKGKVVNDWLSRNADIIRQGIDEGMIHGQARNELIGLLAKYAGAEPYNPSQRMNLRNMNERLGVMPMDSYGTNQAQALMDKLRPTTRFVGGAGVGGTVLSDYGGPAREGLPEALRQLRANTRASAMPATQPINRSTQPMGQTWNAGAGANQDNTLLQLLLMAMGQGGTRGY